MQLEIDYGPEFEVPTQEDNADKDPVKTSYSIYSLLSDEDINELRNHFPFVWWDIYK